MSLMREETFGPVLPVLPFDSDEEAIRARQRQRLRPRRQCLGKDRARHRRRPPHPCRLRPGQRPASPALPSAPPLTAASSKAASDAPTAPRHAGAGQSPLPRCRSRSPHEKTLVVSLRRKLRPHVGLRRARPRPHALPPPRRRSPHPPLCSHVPATNEGSRKTEG